MSLSKLWKIVKDRAAWCAAVHRVTKSWTWLIDYATTNYIKQTTNEGIRNKEKMENGALVGRNAFQKRQGRLWRGWRAGFEDLKFWSVPHLLSAFSIQDTEDSVLNKTECLQKTHSLEGKDISQILSQYLVTSEVFNEQWFIEQHYVQTLEKIAKTAALTELITYFRRWTIKWAISRQCNKC